MSRNRFWRRISKAYRVVNEVDQHFKALADGDRSALGQIMSLIEHQGRLYPLAVPIIPRLLKTLDKNNRADKAALFEALHQIVEVHDEACEQLKTLRGEYARILIHIQRAFENVTGIYIKHLLHADTTVRQFAVRFVTMYVHNPRARVILHQVLRMEVDRPTRATIIYHLGLLPPSHEHNGNAKANTTAKQGFLDLMMRDESRQIKLACAFAWCLHQLSETFGRNSVPPDVVFDFLLDVTLDKYGAFIPPELRDEKLMALTMLREENRKAIRSLESSIPKSIEILSQINTTQDELAEAAQHPVNHNVSDERLDDGLPEFVAEVFVPDYALRMLRSFGPQVHRRFLDSPKLTPLLAHIICRDSLDEVFERIRHHHSTYVEHSMHDADWSRWLRYTDLFRINLANPPDMMYQSPGVINTVRRDRFDEPQYRALKAVVDCDVFWELPTNIFSFFYGFPDDREGLRQLLEDRQPQWMK